MFSQLLTLFKHLDVYINLYSLLVENFKEDIQVEAIEPLSFRFHIE
jgi:hypothetical protein